MLVGLSFCGAVSCQFGAAETRLRRAVGIALTMSGWRLLSRAQLRATFAKLCLTYGSARSSYQEWRPPERAREGEARRRGGKARLVGLPLWAAMVCARSAQKSPTARAGLEIG